MPKGQAKRHKIDEGELIKLANVIKDDGGVLTHEEIATEMGVSRVGVTRALQRIPPEILSGRTVEEYRQNRAKMFAGMQRMILQNITPEKLKMASLAQLGTLFGIFYDKERLEKGQSTENNAMAIRLELDDESKAKVQEAIAALTHQKIKTAREEAHGQQHQEKI